MTAADLTLPPELLPSDGRFGSGPSKVRDEAVAALAGRRARLPRHEPPPRRRALGRRPTCARGLRDLFSLPDGYEVLLGLGGSTLFWDAASFGLVERRSTHLVIGEFSSKFAQVDTRPRRTSTTRRCARPRRARPRSGPTRSRATSTPTRTTRRRPA